MHGENLISQLSFVKFISTRYLYIYLYMTFILRVWLQFFSYGIGGIWFTNVAAMTLVSPVN